MKSTIILFFTLCSLTLSSFSQRQVQEYREQADPFLTWCTAPVDFKKPSNVDFFLKVLFNDNRYAEHYFPYSFTSHLFQFLERSNTVTNPLIYCESTLRLFYNQTKRAEFICADEFLRYLQKGPQYVLNAIKPQSQLLSKDLEQNIVDIFVPSFLKGFDLFKSQPERFLKDIAHNVVQLVQNNLKEIDHISIEQLKQMQVKFLEVGLLKLLWAPEPTLDAWQSFIALAQQLESLIDCNLVSIDELDDLFKSLIESFYRFLKLTGHQLPLSVIEAMHHEAASSTLFIFELEEQEAALQTKRDRILTILIELHAKVEAQNRGIVIDPTQP